MIDWAVASRRLHGEERSGDSCTVTPYDGGTLLAVADGLGHGPEAALASERAVDLLASAAGPDLVTLMESCHRALRGTRGAVVTLVSIDDATSTLTWLGVGDAPATLVRSGFSARPRETLLLRPGIVGQSLPRLVTESLPVYAGDTLVMCTDGLQSRYIEGLEGIGRPQAAADRLLADYGRDYDDVLVIVACFLGRDG